MKQQSKQSNKFTMKSMNQVNQSINKIDQSVNQNPQLNPPNNPLVSYKSYHEWSIFSGTSQPYFLASLMDSPSSEAWCISFLGIQPTLTQVPPRPHTVPTTTQNVPQRNRL